MSHEEEGGEARDREAAAALRGAGGREEEEEEEEKRRGGQDEPSGSLEATLLEAQELHGMLTGDAAPAARSPEYAAAVGEAAGKVRAVYRAVRAGGVFSANEELADVNTADLKFLLCPFYLADLAMMAPGAEAREAGVRAGVAYARAFLEQCDALGLLSRLEQRTVRVAAPEMTGEERRAAKIARYRRDKELEAQLAAITDRRREARRRAGAGGLQDGGEDEDDEEREWYTATLRLAVGRCLDHLRFGAEELEMLKHRKGVLEGRMPRPEQRQRPPGPPQMMHIPGGGRPAQPVRLGGGAGSGAGPPVGGYAPAARTIDGMVQQRAGSRAAVFRDANAATKSVDQWVDEQQAAGLLPTPGPPPRGPRAVDANRVVDRAALDEARELAALGERGEDEAAAAAADLRTDAEEDAETYRLREWDEFTDAHEKGAGNRGAVP